MTTDEVRERFYELTLQEMLRDLGIGDPQDLEDAREAYYATRP